MNRPDHPDFWIISQALIDTDTRMDQSRDKTVTFVETVGAIVDIESVTYAANQRVLRMVGSGVNRQLATAMATLWMDAFVAGAEFHRIKAAGEQIAPEKPEGES